MIKDRQIEIKMGPSLANLLLYRLARNRYHKEFQMNQQLLSKLLNELKGLALFCLKHDLQELYLEVKILEREFQVYQISDFKK